MKTEDYLEQFHGFKPHPHQIDLINSLEKPTFIGIDRGRGKDYGVTTVWERPGRMRKLLRRIGVDKSTWNFRLVTVKRHDNHTL